MKWVFIVITWYGMHVPAKGVEVSEPTPASCERVRARYEEMLSSVNDPAFGYRITECEKQE